MIAIANVQKEASMPIMTNSSGCAEMQGRWRSRVRSVGSMMLTIGVAYGAGYLASRPGSIWHANAPSEVTSPRSGPEFGKSSEPLAYEGDPRTLSGHMTSSAAVADPIARPAEQSAAAAEGRATGDTGASAGRHMTADFMRDAYAATLTGENRDNAWAVRAEQRIVSQIRSASRAGTALESVDCRETLCKVDVRHTSQATYEAFLDDTFTRARDFIWNAPVFISRKEGAGEDVHVVMYIAREGYSLPTLE
ncbi:hypothetical protein [Pendulispora albinea]|uniref:Uncharacterized protein n=1 Tax=Pendulispora albinea TaxID=2741071 RepID=A0ABZ2LQY8_9BACT